MKRCYLELLLLSGGFLQKLFDLYKKKLIEISKTQFKDPISYCRKKIKTLLQEEKKLIKLRNEYFIKGLDSHTESKVAIIIGHRHIAHLEKRLKELGHTVTIPPIIKTTLPQDNFDEMMLKSLQNI